MRMFYLAYKDDVKLAQLVPVLPWGHNILIMQKIKNTKEREYYIKSGINLGWSRNVLLNQIKALTQILNGKNPLLKVIASSKRSPPQINYA